LQKRANQIRLVPGGSPGAGLRPVFPRLSQV
jgi:hypothetical protein